MDLTPLFRERSDYLQEFILFPNDIMKLLDKHIIGQDKAKRVISIACFIRSLRMLQSQGSITLLSPIYKHNILLIGPTGSGKTALMRAVAETLDILVTVYDVSGITSSGYVGGDIDDIINAHMYNANQRVLNRSKGYESAADQKRELDIESRFGIVYLDEFDKCRKTGHGMADKDINGQSVQQELLKLLEGQEISYRAERMSKSLNHFNCSDTLFICGGAYVGLSDVVLDRLNKKSSIGFTQLLSQQKEDYGKILDQLTNEDLENYGFLPEILGRLTTHAVLNDLTVENLVDILKNPHIGLISEYTSFFELFGVDLKFESAAILEIAMIVKEKKVGARGLRSFLLKLLETYQYDIMSIAPNQTITITPNEVKNTL